MVLPEFLDQYWVMLPEWMRLVLWTAIKIGMIMLPIIVCVAYLTYAERKAIGYFHSRIGPNRVGPWGLGQPWADVFKMLTKEIVVPTNSNRYLFLIAPILAFAPSIAAWAVIPFSPTLTLSNINAGLLYLLAMTSLGVYGVLIAGWASNSKYALLGAMRSAAQIVAYEIAMGFALVGVLMASNSLNVGDIIRAQHGGWWHWFFLPLCGLFLVYFISGVAETNRAPFDVAEGESEIVAGFHVEYGGFGFAVFFLAEYANMILISALTAILFLGGWMSPFAEAGWTRSAIGDVPLLGWLVSDGFHWFALKTAFFLLCYLWFRATFPRYRYDQIMRLGWKVLIPVTIVWIFGEGIAIALGWKPWT